MPDAFASHSSGLADPPTDAFAITPDDGVDLATIPRALELEFAGRVKVIMLDGSTVTRPMQAGINPGRVRRVYDTGTDSAVKSGLIIGLL